MFDSCTVPTMVRIPRRMSSLLLLRLLIFIATGSIRIAWQLSMSSPVVQCSPQQSEFNRVAPASLASIVGFELNVMGSGALKQENSIFLLQ